MKKEDIKTLEDAMTYISEMEEKDETRSVEIEALNTKVKKMEDDNKKITDENKTIKEKYFDLWLKEGRQTKTEEPKGEQTTDKTIDELLMEE